MPKSVKSEKSATWPTETVQELTAMYDGDNSKLPEIAAKLKKSVPSIRSKLVNLGVYVKPETPKKVGGASSVRKIQLVNEVAEHLKMGKGSLESLEKASKADLESLLKAVTISLPKTEK